MSVLSSNEIQERLELSVTHPDSLVITPIPDIEKVLDHDSIDLRLGCHFLLPRSTREPFYCQDSASSNSLHRGVHVPLGEYIVIPAHQTVLGATLEYIKLPVDLSAEILTKSSVARTFVVIETAPWVHPLYRGCLTLEIANVSNTPVILYPGRLIAQLVLFRHQPANTGGPEEILLSTYFGPVHPEPAKFKDPEQDLKALGVKRVRTYKAEYKNS